MRTTSARTGRIAIGLAITLAALGGGAAAASPTAGDAAPAGVSASESLVAARPAFKAPFQCGTRWRGSAWVTSGGVNHNPPKSVDWNWGSGNDDKGKARAGLGRRHGRVRR